ncbi:MAG: hypothetical protein R2717_00640 [Schumannella sp.]
MPDGQPGELVFTSLTKEAFPVIRYRTRGSHLLLLGTAYPGMRRIEKITGRNDDMIILRGVNSVPHADRGDRPRLRRAHAALVLELTRHGRMTP